MTGSERQGSALRAVVLLLSLVVGVVILFERWAASASETLAAGDELGGVTSALLPALRVYLALRIHVLAYWWLYLPLVVCGPPLVVRGLRRLSASAGAFREELAGMKLQATSYGLRSPFRGGDRIAAVQAAFAREVLANPRPDDAVVLGVDEEAQPVYLTDRARSMHVHLLGQTGSGKTQSAIYPLLYQDAARGRPVLFLDAKGSIDNEQFLADAGAAFGREVKLFTLNPGRASHTYNPLHLGPGADPRAVAERVFATFADEMDTQYYRDMARQLFLALVTALASTGTPMCMWDVAACVADPDVMFEGLRRASDRRAVRTVETKLAELGDRYHQTYSGLLAALDRYDHPAVNAYAPDIVLEDDVGAHRLVGFSLSANAYKFLARAIGIIVLQHVQQLGAARQMDRTLPQAPLYVYADEFYTFAYEGFVDAVNKLRDANVSMLLSHQSLADLDRVSPEFSRAVWDNTRNKIVLYQSDPELCERLASSLGTRQAIKQTVRRSADAWLNGSAMLEASSREVDEFVLHPSRPKSLRTGEAYLVQTGIAERPVTGVHLPLLPELPHAPLPAGTPPAERPDGLYLYEAFVDRGVAS